MGSMLKLHLFLCGIPYRRVERIERSADRLPKANNNLVIIWIVLDADTCRDLSGRGGGE